VRVRADFIVKALKALFKLRNLLRTHKFQVRVQDLMVRALGLGLEG